MSQAATHDLVALANYRQLIAGAVSDQASVYAVLEKTGKILILQLSAHEGGGIHTCDSTPTVVNASLRGLDSRVSATCLRFDPSGRKLYALDPGGRLLVVSFKAET